MHVLLGAFVVSVYSFTEPALVLQKSGPVPLFRGVLLQQIFLEKRKRLSSFADSETKSNLQYLNRLWPILQPIQEVTLKSIFNCSS